MSGPAPICRHSGCDRATLRTGNPRTDPYCSKHDGYRFHGLICLCPVARPNPGGECVDCRRAVVQVWPAARFLAALDAFPTIIPWQRVDWTARVRHRRILEPA